jgi:hypothetical protein
MSDLEPQAQFNPLLVKRWQCMDVECFSYSDIRVLTGFQIYAAIPLPPRPDDDPWEGMTRVRVVMFSMEYGT